MTGRVKVLLVVALLISAPLTGFADAGPGQLDPEAKPRSSGPISAFGHVCSHPFKDAKGLGKGLSGEICTFTFTFDDLSETDPLYDYGIAWAQISIDHEDLCFTRVDPKIVFGALPPAYKPKIITVGPADPIEIGRPSTTRVEVLSSIAEAMTGELATISQGLRVYPDRLSEPLVEEDENGQPVATWSWSGKAKEPLAFAVGAVISWRVDQAAALSALSLHPLDLAFGSLNFKGGTC